MAQFKPQTRTVSVLVGQTVTVNFKIGPDVVHTENVTVVGTSRLVETRTSRDSARMSPPSRCAIFPRTSATS